MHLSELLNSKAIEVNLRSREKREIIAELVENLEKAHGLSSGGEILDRVLKREGMMSTGIGNGIAIPHGKLPELNKLYGLFARLEKPIDFDAVDDQPVDLIFLLLAPEGAGADHLKALARVSRLLRDRKTCEKLRGSDEAEALYSLLTEPAASHAA